MHRFPFASDIPFLFTGQDTGGFCSPLSSAGSTLNMKVRGGGAVPPAAFLDLLPNGFLLWFLQHSRFAAISGLFFLNIAGS
jgi:hypothetical protein